MNRTKKIKIISISIIASLLVVISLTAFILGSKLGKSKSKLMDDSAVAWKNDKNKTSDQWAQVKKSENVYVQNNDNLF